MSRRNVPAMLDFLSPLSLLPGMGPKRIAALQEAGTETVGELLYRFPLRYLDRSVVTPLKSVGGFLDRSCTVSGIVATARIERGRKSRLRALLSDGTGSLELLWFRGIPYCRNFIRKGIRIIATGKITRFTAFQMVHPVVEVVTTDAAAVLPVLPLYGLTGAMRDAGIGQQFMRKTVQWIFKNCKHYPQSLPQPIESRHAFPPLAACLQELHFPTAIAALEPFRERLRFEELYRLALTLHSSRKNFLLPGRPLRAGPLRQQLLRQLPFTLTDDQKDAIGTLLDDIAAPRRMHRLLQGDVGSGKTVVAFFTLLPALNEGLQAVWMTPTEVLARQTWRNLDGWLRPLGYCADLLTSATEGGGHHTGLRRRIASGESRCIVGTHALLQSSVSFRAAGIFIIDEQHRFGARQRLMLHEKDRRADVLLMSATPIPQTLAQTLYGDLDIVTIRSLPPGRQPVATHLVPGEKRADMEKFIKKRIASGAQCYYIVPRIEREESEDETEPPLHDLKTTFAALTRGAFNDLPAAFIHGKLDSEEKERILGDFACGKTVLLVATSVIEVGIDVSAASIIVIENSERFGLAQLHQLRGRVGRSRKKAYCFLLTSGSVTPEAGQRLKSFCSEHDGFAVAELDLNTRGPGEVTGYRQSGWDNLLVADILRDAQLFAEIRSEIGHYLYEHSVR
ncbi:MAG: ATP-dependent DNA helicase RecG [Chitinispirillaceae bacterium]|nr:ATP-dependent DNA helicase RecG [Chitinispirillaceae bacterium]